MRLTSAFVPMASYRLPFSFFEVRLMLRLCPSWATSAQLLGLRPFHRGWRLLLHLLFLPLLLECDPGVMQPRSQTADFLLGGLALLFQRGLLTLSLFQGAFMFSGLAIYQAFGPLPGLLQLRKLRGLFGLRLGSGLCDHPLQGFHHARGIEHGGDVRGKSCWIRWR